MCIEVTSTPTATSSQQTTPTATSPLLCYSCSRANREECDESQTVQTCDVGDVCRLVVFRVAQAFGGGVVSFQRGCFPNASCTESDECRGTLGGNCIRCCDSNLCNDGDIDTIPTTGNTNMNTYCLHAVGRILSNCFRFTLFCVQAVDS